MSDVFPHLDDTPDDNHAEDGGQTGGRDPALEYFRADAKAKGMSLTAYLKEAGILSAYSLREIRKYEVPLEDER